MHGPGSGLTRRGFLTAAGLAVPAFVAACSTESSQTSAGTPDFTITAYQGEDVLGGKTVKFSKAFDNSKPVVLNFWAGLCPPCRAEMPGFQKVFDQFREKIVLVGVDIGPYVGLGQHADAQRLLAELGIHYPAAFAVDATPLKLYQIRAMPTTVFLTAHGRVVDTVSGMLVESQMREKIQRLMSVA